MKELLYEGYIPDVALLNLLEKLLPAGPFRVLTVIKYVALTSPKLPLQEIPPTSWQLRYIPPFLVNFFASLCNLCN